MFPIKRKRINRVKMTGKDGTGIMKKKKSQLASLF